eukprot:3436563-Pleurochrysis_carterae.AAC.1
MMRETRNRVEGEQKGARKATRTRKAGVNLFTALEPPLGSNPIFRMRQEVLGPNELEDCGGLGRIRYGVVGRPGLSTHSRVALWPPSFQEKHVNVGCNQNSQAFRGSTSSRIVVETIRLLGKATSEVLPSPNGEDNRLSTSPPRLSPTTTTTTTPNVLG